MQSNVNALIIAWTTSLIVVVGGVLFMEAMHTPDQPAAATEQAPEDSTPASEGTQNNGVQATPAGEQAASVTLPQANGGRQSASLAAPGEAIAPQQAIALDPMPSIQVAALPDLLEQTSEGFLPKVSSDGRKAFTAYAAPRPLTTANARIAIMVTDLGQKSRPTRRALADLPKDVALAFSPYSGNLNNLAEQGRQGGHEVFLTIPMEPVNYPQNDPGPFTLLTSYGRRESINMLKKSLERMTGYVGVVNHMGSRFTAASDSLRPILDEINLRGLMFVDSRTTPYSRAASMARAIGLPVAINNGYIDEDLAREQIAEQLTKLEQRAKVQGTAMGMARPYPVSIDAIKVWAATLEERGFALVPVSSIANQQALPR